MNITWYGQSFIKIEAHVKNENVILLAFPFDPQITGLKIPRTVAADIVLTAGDPLPPATFGREGSAPVIVSGPGEYEIKGVFVRAIPLSGQTGGGGHIFWIEAEDIVLVHTGMLNYVPPEDALQEINDLDVLFVPVGGGDVLDAQKAAALVSELEPRLVIPTMHNLPGLKKKLASVDVFVKAAGAQSERTAKLKLARKDLPAADMKIVILEQS